MNSSTSLGHDFHGASVQDAGDEGHKGGVDGLDDKIGEEEDEGKYLPGRRIYPRHISLPRTGTSSRGNQGPSNRRQ